MVETQNTSWAMVEILNTWAYGRDTEHDVGYGRNTKRVVGYGKDRSLIITHRAVQLGTKGSFFCKYERKNRTTSEAFKLILINILDSNVSIMQITQQTETYPS